MTRRNTDKKRSVFAKRIYEMVKKVPAGQVITYKALAEALGTRAYQAVGQALARSPGMPEVPCHRVIKSSGDIGGFGGKTDKRARERKKALLKKEGVNRLGLRVKMMCFF